jgi:hypothetical protein
MRQARGRREENGLLLHHHNDPTFTYPERPEEARTGHNR